MGCAISPVTKAPGIQPSRKPAVGPARTPSPPRPPARTGSPRITSRTTSAGASAPRQGPSMEPASITPKVCRVMGTGRKPSGIGGMMPSATIRAAKRGIRTRSRLFILPFTFFRKGAGEVGRITPGLQRQAHFVGGAQQADGEWHHQAQGAAANAARGHGLPQFADAVKYLGNEAQDEGERKPQGEGRLLPGGTERPQ